MQGGIPVEGRPSPIHGNGAFATRPISAGERIGEYTGSPSAEDGTYVLWVEGDDGEYRASTETTSCVGSTTARHQTWSSMVPSSSRWSTSSPARSSAFTWRGMGARRLRLAHRLGEHRTTHPEIQWATGPAPPRSTHCEARSRSVTNAFA